jgi:cysteine synthase B
MDISQSISEQTTRDLATEEGIFAGISSGGAVACAIELSKKVNNAVIVTVICDRGDRYLSTGVFRRS